MRSFPELRASGPREVEGGEPASVRSRRMALRRSEMRPRLFGYQAELSVEMGRVIGGRTRALLALPTGAGKTRTAMSALLDAFSGGRCEKVVWLAPSVELIDQAVETARDLWAEHGSTPDLVLYRGLPREDIVPLSITFATPQAVYSRVKRGKSVGNAWDAVVFDEAHQLGARTFSQAVDALIGELGKTALIGLSATPGRVDRMETEELVRLFHGNMLISKQLKPNPVRTLQRRGILSKLEFLPVGDAYDASSSEADRTVAAARLAVHLAGTSSHVLVFTPSVAGAIVMAEAVRSKGVSASAVYAGISEDERSHSIAQFGDGSCRVLTNHKLLATGYDCPAVSELILVGKIMSPILFEQVVGRAARGVRTGGSRVSRVWQFDDHLAIHGLPQSYYRYRDFDWER